MFADCLVVCRPTQREAEEYYRYAVLENADWAAIDLRIERRAGSGKEAGRDALTRARSFKPAGTRSPSTSADGG